MTPYSRFFWHYNLNLSCNCKVRGHACKSSCEQTRSEQPTPTKLLWLLKSTPTRLLLWSGRRPSNSCNSGHEAFVKTQKICTKTRDKVSSLQITANRCRPGFILIVSLASEYASIAYFCGHLTSDHILLHYLSSIEIKRNCTKNHGICFRLKMMYFSSKERMRFFLQYNHRVSTVTSC